MNEIDATLAELIQGVEEIQREQELAAKLRKRKPLTVKVGFDPTAPDLHLGHTVLINKMRQFQQMGHEVVVLIGDFTGLIGDPSGKNAVRPPISPEEIRDNAKTYQDQVFKILDPERTRVCFNSQWMDGLGAAGLIQLAARNTVARMLERDDFKKRFAGNQAIGIHEFLYPLVQGYDSVALAADVELGGTDQLFNLLMGRELQRHYGQEQQVIMTMPLLEGLDGHKKMSKTLGNYVAVDDRPDDMFGKIMSVSDELMWRYFTLLSFRGTQEIEVLRESVRQGRNPRDVKFELAVEIVSRFHDQASARQAKHHFIDRFAKGLVPEDIPTVQLEVGDEGIPIANLLKEARLVASTSEGLRMLKQGAVRIDSAKIEDGRLVIGQGSSHIVQVGKRRIAKVLC